MTNEITKTILFVDDERSVLSSIRRLLRREDWKLLFANSGLEALDLLQDHSVDLVVSDMRMPEMDGADFLKKVRQLYPETVRIVLTGYAERAAVSRAFEEADIHEMICKPWDDDELKTIIRTSLQQSEDQDIESPGLHKLINDIDSLPTLPHVYLEVRAAIEQVEETSTEKVATAIEQDPAMVAKILQIANSAFFGQRRQIETVQRALFVLGIEMVENLVLSTYVFQILNSEELEDFNAADLWQHAMCCGTVGRVLAEEKGIDKETKEKVILAAILHDLGKLALAKYAAKRYAQVIELARQRQVLTSEVERELLHTDHAAVGGYLADWWNLPDAIVDAIRYHEEPAMSQTDRQVTAFVHLANVMTHRLGMGSSNNGRNPDIELPTLDEVDLDEQALEKLESTLRQKVTLEDFPSF